MSASQQPVRTPRILSPSRLDRRRWAATIGFQSYGARAAVRVDDPALLDEVRARLPFGWLPAEPGEDQPRFSLVTHRRMTGRPGECHYTVYAPDGMTIQTAELTDALDDLESRLQIYVAEMAHDRVFLHAGVVGLNGRAIVLPGRSYAGKSTLVREFVRAGALYYSDEYAVLDACGLVHPFTRPLAIRVDGRQTKYAVEILGPPPASEPAAVGLVLCSSYRARARWRPERLSRGQGLLELLENAVPARRKPAAVMETLEAVVSRAPIFRVERGEARSMVRRAIELLER
jgi:hypothetical protein